MPPQKYSPREIRNAEILLWQDEKASQEFRDHLEQELNYMDSLNPDDLDKWQRASQEYIREELAKPIDPLPTAIEWLDAGEGHPDWTEDQLKGCEDGLY